MTTTAASPPLEPCTAAQSLAHLATSRPQELAVTDSHGSLDYATFATDVARVTAMLQQRGFRPGDRIAILGRNSIDQAILMYAASWSGLALVCLNWRLSAVELKSILEDSVARLVFVDEEFGDLLPDSIETVVLDPSHEGSRLRHWAPISASRVGPPHASRDTVVLQMYTTGTTGSPKGVQLTEENLWEMCRTASDAWRMHGGMVFMAALPMFHISGMSALLTTIHNGGHAVFPAGTDADELAKAMEEFGVTHTVLVPTILTSLVESQVLETHDLSRLEVLVYGAAPAGSALIASVMERLPWVGFSQGYGLTETAAGVAIAPILRHGDTDPAPGSVGQVVANAEVRIVDPETGEDVPTGADGEIWIRSRQLTPGYWGKPDLTAEAIDEQGWFRSGDIGTIDAGGFLYVRDRLKDMIISGGENIYSVEVENAILAHPAVRECAVYGVPDPHWGEAVKAVVVKRSEVTEGELLQHLAHILARYKRPRLIEFADALPKTGSGKILKRELRDRDATRRY